MTTPVFVPFSVIRRGLNVQWPIRTDKVQIDKMFFLDLMRLGVFLIQIDEPWYRRRYLDIDAAITAGEFRNAWHHYSEFGFFEDRLPRHISVDPAFYFTEYPDVSPTKLGSQAEPAQWHFETYGFQEGRLPRAGWTLLGQA